MGSSCERVVSTLSAVWAAQKLLLPGPLVDLLYAGSADNQVVLPDEDDVADRDLPAVGDVVVVLVAGGDIVVVVAAP